MAESMVTLTLKDYNEMLVELHSMRTMIKAKKAWNDSVEVAIDMDQPVVQKLVKAVVTEYIVSNPLPADSNQEYKVMQIKDMYGFSATAASIVNIEVPAIEE